MQKGISYVLIFLFGLQSVGLNAMNVANFSTLISHYQHHKIDHQDSFLEFIDLHYGSQQQAHSDEHDEHENLPFHEGYSFLNHIYFDSPELFILCLIQIYSNEEINSNYLASFSFLHSKEILQPPKNLIDFRS